MAQSSSAASAVTSFVFDSDHPENFNAWRMTISLALRSKGLHLFIDKPLKDIMEAIANKEHHGKDEKAISLQAILKLEEIRSKKTNDIIKRQYEYVPVLFLQKQAEAVKEIAYTLSMPTKMRFNDEILAGDPYNLFIAIKNKSVNQSMQSKENILQQLENLKMDSENAAGIRKLFFNMRQIYNQLSLIDTNECSEDKQMLMAFKKVFAIREPFIKQTVVSLRTNYSHYKDMLEMAKNNTNAKDFIIKFDLKKLEEEIITAINLVASAGGKTADSSAEANIVAQPKKYNNNHQKHNKNEKGDTSAIPCVFYKRNKCNKGNRCEFKHAGGNKFNKNNNNKNDDKKSDKICFSWKKAGKCERGDKCAFAHDGVRRLNTVNRFNTKTPAMPLILAGAADFKTETPQTVFDSGCGEHYASISAADPKSVLELEEPVTVNGFSSGASETIKFMGSITQKIGNELVRVDNVLLGDSARHTLLSVARLADDSMFSLATHDEMIMIENKNPKEKKTDLKRKLVKLINSDKSIKITGKIRRTDANVYASSSTAKRVKRVQAAPMETERAGAAPAENKNNNNNNNMEINNNNDSQSAASSSADDTVPPAYDVEVDDLLFYDSDESESRRRHSTPPRRSK
jgi:hypothetical protein